MPTYKGQIVRSGVKYLLLGGVPLMSMASMSQSIFYLSFAQSKTSERQFKVPGLRECPIEWTRTGIIQNDFTLLPSQILISLDTITH